jgi:hypothetical protein
MPDATTNQGGHNMVIDHRTYTIKPGKLNDFLEIYGAEGFPLQKKYLGHCVGWYFSNDIGQLNQVVHMWAYKDLNDRADRRKSLADYIVSQENKILTAAPFFTLPEVKG